jgi:AraC family ethanolamine operon transcriptional activator
MPFPAGFCVKCRIDDVDEWRERALYWGLEPFQLGKGRFRSDLRAIHTENLQVSSGWRSTGVLVRGQGPRDCVVLAMVRRAQAPIHYRGAVLAGNQIVALRHGEDIELSTKGGAEMLTVSVDAATLDQRMRALLGKPLDHWRIHERLQLAHPGRYGRLNRALVRYLDFALSSEVTAYPDGARRLESRILETLVASVGFPQIQAPRPWRLHLAKVAEEYLRAHADTPVSVSELCEITGINQRTLFLGFQERYGLSPKAYLKMLRLNAARRELLRSAPGDSGISVTRLATKWGFFHLGRFSIDYRAMFGESPIETLKRPSRQNGSARGGRVSPASGPGEWEEPRPQVRQARSGR